MISRDLKGINKYTVSKADNGIRYESGMLNQENRIAIETADRLNKKNQFFKSGYNGTPLIDTMIDFQQKFPKLRFEDPSLLYDQIITDARTLPAITQIADRVNDFYLTHFMIHLNNIYRNSPKFFADNFINSLTGFERYQLYYYLLCFIQYFEEHGDDELITRMNNIDKVKTWVATRRDPNISYIIVGPTDNTPFNINYEEHYATLMSTAVSMSDIAQYQQLTTAQTTSVDVLKILQFVTTNPNVFVKTPDEAKKYTINIDSAAGVLVEVDKNNNLLFDCGYLNLGDTTEQDSAATYDTIDSVNTSGDQDSKIPTKKLEKIFNMYSRIKILEFVIAADTYITSLDVFPKVFLVFQGVACSERNVYNTVENNDFKIGGTFVRTNRGYEFKQDVDAITYKSTKTKVTAFRLFISTDPNAQNIIIPNEFAIKCNKNMIYQHPILTNQPLSKTNLTSLKLPSITREYVRNQSSSVDPNNSLLQITSHDYATNNPINSTINSTLTKLDQHNIYVKLIQILNPYLHRTLANANDVVNNYESLISEADLAKYNALTSDTDKSTYILEHMTPNQLAQFNAQYYTEINESNLIQSIFGTTNDSKSTAINLLNQMFDTFISTINSLNNLINSLQSPTQIINSYQLSISSVITNQLANISSINGSINLTSSSSYMISQLISAINSFKSFETSLTSFVHTEFPRIDDVTLCNLNDNSIDKKDIYLKSLYGLLNKSIPERITESIDSIIYQLRSASVSSNNLSITNYIAVCQQLLESIWIIDAPNKSFNDRQQIYDLLYRELINTFVPISSASDTQTYLQTERVVVDNNLGTINGQYFRVINEFPVFTDENGNPFTTPDPRYLLYNDSNNDLCLYNLYSYDNNKIVNVINGSFIYSESMRVIQNLSYILENHSKCNNMLMFDNSYNMINCDNELCQVVPEWKYDINSTNNMPMTTWKELFNQYSQNELSSYYMIVISEITDGIDDGIDSPTTFGTSFGTSSTTYLHINHETETCTIYDDIHTESINNILISDIFNAKYTEMIMSKILYSESSDNRLYTVYRSSYTHLPDIQLYYNYHHKYQYYLYESDEFNIQIRLTSYSDNQASKSIRITNTPSLIISIQSTNLPNYSTYTNYHLAGSDYTNNYLFSGVCMKCVDDFQCVLLGYVLINDEYYFVNQLFNYEYRADSKRIIINILLNQLVQITSGPLMYITITDQLGNTFITEQGEDNKIAHNLQHNTANSFKELNNLTITDSDSSNNKIEITYRYFTVNSQTYLIIENKKITSGDAVPLYNSLIYNMTDESIYMVNSQVNDANEFKQLSNHNKLITCVKRICSGDNVDNNYMINVDKFDCLIKYDTNSDIDYANSNKAYYINGIDIKCKYWNKSLYINSMLHAHIPVVYRYYPLTTESTYSTDDSAIKLYTIDKQGFKHMISGVYSIKRNGIYKQEGLTLRMTDIDDMYVYTNKLLRCSFVRYNVNEGIIVIKDIEYYEPNCSKQFMIYDENINIKYVLEIMITNEVMNKVVLFARQSCVSIMDPNKNVTYNVPIGEYSLGIKSGIPFYIQNCEIVITYNHVETLEKNKYEIKSISLTTAINKTIRYISINNQINQQLIPTMKYSNIPGNISANDDFFSMDFTFNNMFKHHPTVKYVEKSFVKPKLVDKNNNYITMINKFNQSLVTSNIYIRSGYNLDNKAENEHSSTSVAKKINGNIDHIMESYNENMIMIGNMAKSGYINEIAILSENVYLVPQSSKLLLTLEFS